MIEDLDLYVLCHDAFGKGAMKKIGISPDAFAQVSMNTANGRLRNQMTLKNGFY